MHFAPENKLVTLLPKKLTAITHNSANGHQAQDQVFKTQFYSV